MTTDFQKNALGHLRRTLADLASADRQRQYKAAVPFGHVPIELLEQWAGHRHHLRKPEFHAIFSDTELAALARFDAVVTNASSQLGDVIDDVPEILEREPWCEIMRAAEALLPLMPPEL